jgi:hypothetical protein
MGIWEVVILHTHTHRHTHTHTHKSKYNTLAHHCTLNLVSVLSLVFTIHFLAMDLLSLTVTSNITVNTAHVMSSTNTLSVLGTV